MNNKKTFTKTFTTDKVESDNHSDKPKYNDRSDKLIYNNRSDKSIYDNRSDKPKYNDRSDKPIYKNHSDKPIYDNRSDKPRYNYSDKPKYNDCSDKPKHDDYSNKSRYNDRSEKPRYNNPNYNNRLDKPRYDNRIDNPNYNDRFNQPRYDNNFNKFYDRYDPVNFQSNNNQIDQFDKPRINVQKKNNIDEQHKNEIFIYDNKKYLVKDLGTRVKIPDQYSKLNFLKGGANKCLFTALLSEFHDHHLRMFWQKLFISSANGMTYQSLCDHLRIDNLHDFLDKTKDELCDFLRKNNSYLLLLCLLASDINIDANIGIGVVAKCFDWFVTDYDVTIITEGTANENKKIKFHSDITFESSFKQEVRTKITLLYRTYYVGNENSLRNGGSCGHYVVLKPVPENSEKQIVPEFSKKQIIPEFSKKQIIPEPQIKESIVPKLPPRRKQVISEKQTQELVVPELPPRRKQVVQEPLVEKESVISKSAIKESILLNIKNNFYRHYPKQSLLSEPKIMSSDQDSKFLNRDEKNKKEKKRQKKILKQIKKDEELAIDLQKQDSLIIKQLEDDFHFACSLEKQEPPNDLDKEEPPNDLDKEEPPNDSERVEEMVIHPTNITKNNRMCFVITTKNDKKYIVDSEGQILGELK